MLNSNPVFLELKAKTTFIAVAPIKLREWDRLDEASAWAERRWLSEGQKFRRTVQAADEQAHFEFEHDDETVEFLLKFG